MRRLAIVAFVLPLLAGTYDGAGSSNLGAPDLTAIGTRHDGIDFESCVNAGSPMPQFASLGAKRLQQLAIFLEASEGTR